MALFSDAQTGLIALRAHALTDATRIRILAVLARADLPVGKIAATLALEPSTISKHLQVLYRAGFVERRRSASMVIYSLLDPRVLEWCRYLGRLNIKR
jgi:DNA-binding transcriptional ArsR family regulator